MKFKVMNEDKAKKYEEDENHVLIGIRTEESYKVEYENNIKRLDSLLLVFVDLDTPEAESYPIPIIGEKEPSRFIIFNESHAEKILDFYLQYKDKVDLMIVHCEAGWSRSPGVAAALSIIDGKDDRFFFKCFEPNMKVYRTIMNKAVDRGLLI